MTSLHPLKGSDATLISMLIAHLIASLIRYPMHAPHATRSSRSCTRASLWLGGLKADRGMQVLTTAPDPSLIRYARLFSWLVVRINQTVDDVKRAKHYIGLLDVYGFEFFEVNSFAACKCSSRRLPSSPQIRLRVLRSELVRAAVHQLCEREASAILPLDRL